MVRTVFVTVGSTKFEELVETVLSERMLRLLREVGGYRKCIIQAGSGRHQCLDQIGDVISGDVTGGTVKFVRQGVEVNIYRYKKSLQDDQTSADLIISHAGSSSIIESLEAAKRLIVVVNESLMDNHQLEMAEKMYDLGFLLFATCGELEQKIRLIENGEFALNPYTRGNPTLFGNYLNSVLNS